MREIEEGFASVGVQGMRAPAEFLQTHDEGANLGTSSAGGHGKTPVRGKGSR